MMDELDKDLDSIIEYAQSFIDDETINNKVRLEAIGAIKLAFIKAGWTKPDPSRILGDG